jgi:hypothetical protein
MALGTDGSARGFVGGGWVQSLSMKYVELRISSKFEDGAEIFCSSLFLLWHGPSQVVRLCCFVVLLVPLSSLLAFFWLAFSLGFQLKCGKTSPNFKLPPHLQIFHLFSHEFYL